MNKQTSEKNYHIISERKGWNVRMGGSLRASFRFLSKSSAIRKGKKMARKFKCLLFIHQKDGRIRKMIDFRGKNENR